VPIVRNSQSQFPDANWIEADLSNEGDSIRAATQVASMCSEPSDIVFSAGVLGEIGESQLTSIASLREAFTINCLSIKPFIDATLGLAQPVRYWLVSSGAANAAYAAMLSYCCSKSAASMLFHVYAVENPEHLFGIVNPGPMATAMNAKLKMADTNRFPVLAKFADPELVAEPDSRARQFIDFMAAAKGRGVLSVDLREIERVTRIGS